MSNLLDSLLWARERADLREDRRNGSLLMHSSTLNGFKGTWASSSNASRTSASAENVMTCAFAPCLKFSNLVPQRPAVTTLHGSDEPIPQTATLPESAIVKAAQPHVQEDILPARRPTLLPRNN